jgi:hypothetical protein
MRREPRVTRHHKRPKSRHGGNEPENIVIVPESKHRAFHHLFWNSTPEEIARIPNETWIDPSYVLVVVPRQP